MLNNKLKIGFVLDDTIDTPDGVQQYILTLGKWFSSQGHEVHYLVGQSTRTDILNVHTLAKNIKVRFNQNRLSIPLPSNKKLINKKLNELNLDVIHVQMPYSPLFAGRVINAAPAGTRIVGTFHIVPASWLQSVGARSLQLLSRQTLKKFDSIVSVSVAAQTFAKTVFGIDSEIIPNAVSLEYFKRDPIRNKILTIVFLGRLVERKGCLYLLKALKHLNSSHNGKYNVIIAGKGPLLNKLETYKNKNSLNNVKFIGFVEENNKPKLLASADIAVFPSTGGESFGIVLIEAMASGSRVVLGGDNVGYRSVLEDHPDLLVDPTDSKAFSNRIKYFLDHKEARDKASQWAQESVKQYDIAVVAKKLLKIYR
jgi:phosphatidylinositol alpha-mannosyltransferase